MCIITYFALDFALDANADLILLITKTSSPH